MNYDQMFPSRFIKAGEFEGRPVTLTIGTVEREGLEREDGHEDMAAILAFTEKRKNGDPIQMVLNKTNAQAIFAMWPDTDDWVGKHVTFFPEPDDSGMSDSGFRIRVQGSPDIEKAITYTLKLPRRKPKQCKLTKTTLSAAARQTPPHDAETGELSLDEKYGETMPSFDDLEG
jgi:hypothetical protein